ncbi:hypothetical protein MKW98_021330 [Papaver atlanticum]|uniref:Cytochrome b5 heme-binding domain-containing protein n=1 Tax=Papaver atlanticum TaxID=357466 RepID=A0AAD4SRK3_9MAGN|nr:hypothetical protein MKW98_021330 [Papaver atlanticum]
MTRPMKLFPHNGKQMRQRLSKQQRNGWTYMPYQYLCLHFNHCTFFLSSIGYSRCKDPVDLVKEAGLVKGGSTVIVFIEDPDGYMFELLGRGPTVDPLCQFMLRAFGMELLRKRDNPEYKYTIAMMGYGPEECWLLICWLLISGKVYDVTEFGDNHPGGDLVLLTAAGNYLIWQGLRARTKKQKYSFSTSSLHTGRVHSQSDAGTPLIWVAGHGQAPSY